MSPSTPSGLQAASPRNSEDYSDSTQTPLRLQWTGLGLGLEICRPLAGGLVRLESEWSLSVQSESNWSPLGKVGECKDLPLSGLERTSTLSHRSLKPYHRSRCIIH
jgi:hypothetical protein